MNNAQLSQAQTEYDHQVAGTPATTVREYLDRMTSMEKLQALCDALGDCGIPFGDFGRLTLELADEFDLGATNCQPFQSRAGAVFTAVFQRIDDDRKAEA